MPAPLRLLSILMALGLVVAGCGGGSASSDGLAGDFSVLGALQELPAASLNEVDGGGLGISVADLDAAAALSDLARPQKGSVDDNAIVEYLGPLTGFTQPGRESPVFVSLPNNFAADRAVFGPQAFIDTYGFTTADIDVFASIAHPFVQFTVATGVSAAPDLVEVEPGIASLGDGEDFSTNLEEISPARALGRPWRVAESDGRVAVGLSTPLVREWLDGSPGGTLADDALLAAAAARLDDFDVVSAYLASASDDVAHASGLGWTVDDNGPLGVIVFAHDSEAAANDASGPAEASFDGMSQFSGGPLTDLVILESFEVDGSDIVATVRFAPDRPPRTLLSLLFQLDGPFAVS